MKGIALPFLLIIFLVSNNFFAQNWLWGKAGVETLASEGWCVATDSSGNVFETGYFSGSLSFGSFGLSSSGNIDAFIVKYDNNGNVLWAKSVGGISDDEFGYSVSTDRFGNAYLTGFFKSNTVTIGSTMLTNAGASGTADIFIVKFNSNGNVLWARSYGGINDDIGNGLTIDKNGNIFITGYFVSTSISFGTQTLSGQPNYFKFFLTKLDTSGTPVWAQGVTGTGASCGNAISIDKSGNIYGTGWFNSSPSFGVFTLTSAGSSDLFLVKLDSSGTILWAKSNGGLNVDLGNGIVVAKGGKIYLTGSYTSPSIIFGAYTFSNFGKEDFFLAKYDTSGNVLWAKRAGESGKDFGYSVSVDNYNNLYVSGGWSNFPDTTNIVFDSDTLFHPQTYGADPMFIVKFDSLGNVLCATSLPCGGDDNNSVATDNFGNVFFGSDYDYNPFHVGNDSLTLINSLENSFIAKYYCGSGNDVIKEFNDKTEMKIWPNPTNGILNIEAQNKIAEIKITNLMREQVITPSALAGSYTGRKLSFDVSSLQNGIYFLQIKTTEGIVTKKIIVQR